MKKNHRQTLIVAMFVSSAILSSCTPSESSYPYTSPSKAEAIYDSDGHLIPTTNIRSAKPREWDYYQPIDNNSIKINFMSGDTNCYGQYVDVKESKTTVTITLIEGRRKNGNHQVCDLNNPPLTLRVNLKSPIADRKVIDGFSDQQRPRHRPPNRMDNYFTDPPKD